MYKISDHFGLNFNKEHMVTPAPKSHVLLVYRLYRQKYWDT